MPQLDAQVFESVVADVIDTIPDELWARVENVRIEIEHEAAGDPGLYGRFDGLPLGQRESWDAMDAPGIITIFRAPLVRDFGGADPASSAQLREQIRITVLHELGHYFGMDERQLEDLGYA